MKISLMTFLFFAATQSIGSTGFGNNGGLFQMDRDKSDQVVKTMIDSKLIFVVFQRLLELADIEKAAPGATVLGTAKELSLRLQEIDRNTLYTDLLQSPFSFRSNCPMQDPGDVAYTLVGEPNSEICVDLAKINSKALKGGEDSLAIAVVALLAEEHLHHFQKNADKKQIDFEARQIQSMVFRLYQVNYKKENPYLKRRKTTTRFDAPELFDPSDLNWQLTYSQDRRYSLGEFDALNAVSPANLKPFLETEFDLAVLPLQMAGIDSFTWNELKNFKHEHNRIFSHYFYRVKDWLRMATFQGHVDEQRRFTLEAFKQEFVKFVIDDVGKNCVKNGAIVQQLSSGGPCKYMYHWTAWKRAQNYYSFSRLKANKSNSHFSIYKYMNGESSLLGLLPIALKNPKMIDEPMIIFGIINSERSDSQLQVKEINIGASAIENFSPLTRFKGEVEKLTALANRELKLGNWKRIYHIVRGYASDDLCGGEQQTLVVVNRYDQVFGLQHDGSHCDDEDSDRDYY